MAADLKDIAVKATKNVDVEKPKKAFAKSSNPEPRSNDPEEKQSHNTNQDFLSLLRNELKVPFLGLLEEYAKRCSPSKDGKDLGKRMFIFKDSHSDIYWLCFTLDLILLLIFISVVIYVGLRGLQVNPFGIIK